MRAGGEGSKEKNGNKWKELKVEVLTTEHMCDKNSYCI